MKNNISILVVPTEECNMHCVYCYHVPHVSNIVQMNFDTLEQLMRITVPNYKRIKFIWHGGEPLLRGIEFYRSVVDLQKKYADNTVVKNLIQTNLTLLDDEYIQFFKENQFGISSSFDGTLNEHTRGNSAVILGNRKKLIEFGNFKPEKIGNVMVLSQKNICDLINSYEFFKENKINYKMNLYIDTTHDVISKELAISSDVYIKEMTLFFDYWLKDVLCSVRVGNFVDLVTYLLCKEKHICCYQSCLGKWLGVRADGTVANCSRYYFEKYRFGNIKNYTKIEEAFQSEGFKNMLLDSIQRREKCKNCEIYEYCQGGCSNIAMFENGMQNNGGNSCLCRIGLYKYVENKIGELKDIPYEKLKNNYNPFFVKIVEKYKKLKKN